MPAITAQQLEDAARDVEDLEKIVNGAADLANPGQPDGTVTTRLGLTTRTVAKVIEDQEAQESAAAGSASAADTSADSAAGAATLAGLYANANTNADIAGATTGERGARYWAGLAGNIANADTEADIAGYTPGLRGAKYWAQVAQNAGDSFVFDPLDPRHHVDLVDADFNIIQRFRPEDPSLQELSDATEIARTSLSSDPLRPPCLDLTDGDGNRIIFVDDKRIDHPKIDSLDSGIDVAKTRAWAAQLIAAGPVDPTQFFRTAVGHLVTFGQSNDSNTADTLSMPPYPAPLIMFNGGPNTRRGLTPTLTTASTGANRASFVPMQEIGSETGVAAALSMMQKLALANGAKIDAPGFNLLGSVCGVGGVSIENLHSTYYFRVTEDIQEAAALAADDNKNYSVLASKYDGNESNQANTAPVGGVPVATTVANFLAQLRYTQTRIQATAQAASGQTSPVPMFIMQTNSHLSTASASYFNVEARVAQAQVAAGLNADLVNDNIIFCGPMYHLPRASAAAGEVHFSILGGAVGDAYVGVAMWKKFFLGIKQMPLVPDIFVEGDYYRLTFPIDANRSLEWDIETVAAQTNYGFRAFSSGGAIRDIGVPQIVGRDTVVIRCVDAAIGDIVDNAIVSSTGGPMGLSNLRDNQGDDIIVDRYGYPLHNFIPAFRKAAA